MSDGLVNKWCWDIWLFMHEIKQNYIPNPHTHTNSHRGMKIKMRGACPLLSSSPLSPVHCPPKLILLLMGHNLEFLNTVGGYTY